LRERLWEVTMCLATVYLEDGDQREEVLSDVIQIEFKGEGVLMTTLLGEEKLFQDRIKSIDLMKGTILIEKGVRPDGYLRVEEGDREGT